MSDPAGKFRAAIRATGLTPPEIIEADGKLHRFATNGKAADRAGWYIVYPDGIPAGAYGCWRSGISETWRANIGRALTPAEEAAHRRKVEVMRRAREAEEGRRHAEARDRAREIWDLAHPAPADHAYLLKKNVQAHGLRVHDGALVIPIRHGAELHSLQFIGADGDKRFLTGGRVSGCYFAIGKPDGALCIAEGYATGASIHEATGYAVALAFNAGNLLPVARTLRPKFPDLRLTVCADDDRSTPGNPGLMRATEAARAVGGLLAVPDFGENRPTGWTDFNDLHRLRGAGAVREAIENAKPLAGDQYGPGEEKAVAGNSEGMRTGTRIQHDRTVTLRELFEEPEESAQWLVEGLFPAAGFSVFAAKPKVGKSTLARQLALAVARGEPFLGRETTQGPVLYVALEEKRTQVRAHFRAMGAGGDESIHIYVASAPENAIAWLSRQIELVQPVLVIIDPLFRLARVRDASAYAEVTAAMEPLLGLARTTGAHVLVTHHATKRGEGTDAILGSTAIFGSVDTAAVLVRTERYRSIATTQRYGEDLSETVLAWDPDTHTASLGGTREEAEIDRLGKEILAYLSDKREPVTEALIDEQIEGRTGPKKKALRVLVRDKRVTRTGEGKRGEPFLYVSSFVVPTYTGEPGNQKPKDDLSDYEAGGYSGSQDHAAPGGSGNQQHSAKPDLGSWGTRI